MQTAVRNNGGGHANHSLFWTVLSPKGGGTPRDAVGKAIASTFGFFDAFKEAFSKAAATWFESAWTWLRGEFGCGAPGLLHTQRGQPISWWLFIQLCL